ncbi:transglycosylase SLT domain-containing protein [Celerinatantimonas sp. YJH-8]|uniref:transglycosylase SLT domain-containing protein n=1 Tax=Celerinatantimonas sp. YJH-8 TaxID=3228714 RepID=UPI0038C78150
MQKWTYILVPLTLIAFSCSHEALAQTQDAYQHWLEQQQQQYQTYKLTYKQRYQQFKQQLEARWHEYTELPDKQKYVQYAKQLGVKTVLDYGKNEIRVEALEGEKLPTAQQVIDSLSQKTVKQTIQTDPLLKSDDADKSKVPETQSGSESLLASLVGQEQGKALSTSDVQQRTIKTRSNQVIHQLVIPLPKNSTWQRAKPYMAQAQQIADQYQLDPKLIVSIMKEESAFNPMAQSPIPAFGLMQVVPGSAGLDVNQTLYHQNQKPTKEQLFVGPVNMRYGGGYLHILNSRYLAKIKDPRSRMYCTIAAYNTGAGNVARAFNPNGSTKLSSAFNRINQMTPEQVYQHLEQNLPYNETRNYLAKVTRTYNTL